MGIRIFSKGIDFFHISREVEIHIIPKTREKLILIVKGHMRKFNHSKAMGFFP